MRESAADAVRRFSAVAMSGVLAVLLVAACNTSDTPDSPLSSPSTTPAASPRSPSPSPSATKSETPDQRDERLAGEAVVELWTVVGQLATRPDENPDLLETVTRDQARSQWQVVLDTYAAKGLVQRGSATVTDISATTKDDKTFAVSACVDVSGVDLVDEKGASKVNPDRPDRQKYTYGVAKTPDGFLVTVDTLKGTPC